MYSIIDQSSPTMVLHLHQWPYWGYWRILRRCSPEPVRHRRIYHRYCHTFRAPECRQRLALAAPQILTENGILNKHTMKTHGWDYYADLGGDIFFINFYFCLNWIPNNNVFEANYFWWNLKFPISANFKLHVCFLKFHYTIQ